MKRIAAGTVYRLLAVAALAGSVCTLRLPVFARTVDLDRPAPGEFVQDWAHMIEASDMTEIQTICEKLLAHHDTSIFVVTITSMAEYSLIRPDTITIETFAQNLFDEWGIGYLRVNGESWNTGILLVVSKHDRKARIELGAGWERMQDDLCHQILNDQIITRFKDGDYSLGILSGVRALDDMARGKPLPARPWTRNMKQTVAIGSGLALFTIVSVFRSGRNGWGWVLWLTVFGALGWVLHRLCGRRDYRGHAGGHYGEGFSGRGGLGGGFSGGGGATGSW